MLLSLILTFASLDPSLQAQAQTQVTKTTDRLVGQLGIRPAKLTEILAAHSEIRAIFQEALEKARAELATKPKFEPATFREATKELEDEFRKAKERANLLVEKNRKLEARLLESQKLLESSQKQAP